MNSALGVLPPPRRVKLVPDQVFAMVVLVFTEVMFFLALVSAFIVIKGTRAAWKVPAEITLPVLLTGYNTAVLFLSGAMLWWAGRLLQRGAGVERVRASVLYAMLFGGFFVAVQGYEWVQLIGYGLTMQSSIFGACFFLLVGSHAVHAVAGILVMAYWYGKCKRSMVLADCRAVQIFWFFIVGIWPLLYGLVYFDALV